MSDCAGLPVFSTGALPARGAGAGRRWAWGLLAFALAGAALAAPAAPAARAASAPAVTEPDPAAVPGEEEFLPITSVDQALRLYRSVCLTALADQVPFADLAISSGLQLVKSSQMARAADPNADDMLVFTPGFDSAIELTIHAETRCTVWLRAEGSRPLARGFQRAVNQLKKEGYAIDWRLDRVLTQKDASRRQLRAEAVGGKPARRARADAALLTPEVKLPAIQAMALQLEGDVPLPTDAVPAAQVPGSSAPVSAAPPPPDLVPPASPAQAVTSVIVTTPAPLSPPASAAR